MNSFVRSVRAFLWFCVGNLLAFCMALVSVNAYAVNCNAVVDDPIAYRDGCAIYQEVCDQSNGEAFCQNGSCQSDGLGYPACMWGVVEDGHIVSALGFSGECPAEGADGPVIGFGVGNGEQPPDTGCSNSCLVETGSCTCIPRRDGGGEYCACDSTHTGEVCTDAESPDNPPEEPCEDCPFPEDGDEDNSQSPMSPQVCIGPLCNEIPPNPEADVDCERNPNNALCVGAPGENGGSPTPPPHPGPPYPPTQAPQWSTSSSNGPNSTPIEVYGPPNDPGVEIGPEGCPPGTIQVGEFCNCPEGSGGWNGSECEDGDGEGGDGDGDRRASYGNCSGPPSCSGDEIDCSIVHQTWRTRCALWGDRPAPVIDLETDPFAAYGGAESLFVESEATGPETLDFSGMGLGSSCPQLPPISVRGQSITFPHVWCDLGWVGNITIFIALLIAGRILGGVR